MQQYPLLQTKLYIPPIRPELVTRPRLVERLNAGISGKLTLISAPAGFGKTTLVSEWVNSLRLDTADESQIAYRIAWLSLDEGDNDPARFLTYIIAALQTLALSADETSRVEGPVLSGVEEPVLSGVEGTQARLEPAAQQEPVGLIGKGALIALQSPQPPPPEAILTSLINEISALPDRIVLVLDDYHLIEAQPIHDALSFLLEHLPLPPGGMQLVIATREDPPLSLARLRARGQLTELRAADMRFSTSEAAEFLNQAMGLDLSAEDLAALETRTEGWIAGLQLAALALQGTSSLQGRQDATSLIESFTGSHRFVLDYLIEEVLEHQSESVQAFLLQTAVLDRLTGSLCDAVRFGKAETQSSSLGTGVRFGSAESPPGRAILERLERANLFIVPLDEERRWYRYHRLFSDLLRQRLRQIQPDWVPTLHRRASVWYEKNGFADEAIEYALRAKDFEWAASLIEAHIDALWQRGEHTRLRRWLAGLPDELLFSKPQLCIFHAWYLFASGKQDAGERSLQVAEEALEPSADRVAERSQLDQVGQQSDRERAKLRGRAAAIRAIMASYRGDVPRIIQHARRALDCLPQQDVAMRSAAAIALGNAYGFRGEMAAAYQARLEAVEASKSAGNSYFSILAHLEVAITLREQGRLQRTIEICRQQVQLADKSGLSQASVAGCLLAIWGEALAEQGELERAKRQTKRGVELTESGDLAMLGWSHLCLMRVLLSKGDMAAAQEIVQKIERIARESDVPPWITNQLATWQARLWLAQGKLEATSQWVRERGLVAAGEPQLPHEFDFFSLNDHVMLARILIAQGRLDAATRLLPRLLEAAEAGERTSTAIEILALQALAFQAGGETDRALSALERALILAEPQGFVRIFVDEGPPMARLLYQAAARGMMPDYTTRLLAAFEATDDADADIADADIRQHTTQTTLDPSSVVGRPPAPARVSSALVEPLSDRELQVLQLLAEGLTNREVASQLFLSLNTVKAHTRNIYGKLNVHSRTQAIARSQELGLLPRRRV